MLRPPCPYAQTNRQQARHTAADVNIAGYEQQLKKPFPYEAELSAKRERLTEVDRIILAKNKLEERPKKQNGGEYSPQNSKIRR